MAINILVIDDDKKVATRLMNNLKRADKAGIIGTVKVDDSVVGVETLEKYDVSHFETTFDVALVDYQLTCTFTGILVSAWLSLYLKIPRLTLTTAAYPGNPDYFNGEILKNEVTDSPEEVIKKIKDCVETFNEEVWLERQHSALVMQYQELLKENDSFLKPEFSEIETLLDRFERVLDAHQDEKIKYALQCVQGTADFKKRQDENEKKLLDLKNTLDHYLEEIEK